MAEKKSEFERRREAFEKSYEADNWDEAIKLGQALRQDFPEQFQDNTRLINRLASPYYNRGEDHKGREKFDDALADYTKAVELNPDYVNAYVSRGVTNSEMGEYDSAFANFDKAIEMEPDNAEAYYNRGITYGRKGEYDNAFVNFNRAIELNSVHEEAYNARGNVYAEKGQYDRAIADYDKAIKLTPDNVDFHHNRALAIGKKAAKETEERLKQSYEEQLASISNPVEINKFFEEEIANSKIRLDKLREEGKEVGETLWRKLGAVWVFSFGAFAGLKVLNPLPIDTIFLQLLSFSFSVIFLSSPFIWHLRRVNHDIRVERHALEDFRRKWIMLLLRVAQGDEAMRNQQTADIIQHFDKRGTPEVLNRLYHPKYAARARLMMTAC